MNPVVIVGGGISSAAVDWQTTADIWGLAAFGPRMKRCDRWFEIHPLSTILPRDLAVCKASQVPVYMGRHYKHIPQSVRYPIEQVLEIGDCIFTNSYCYEIALAIMEERPEIFLYGLGELGQGSARERTFERMGMAYWIGLAKGRGIPVHLPARDSLVTFPLYGLNYWAEVKYIRSQLRDLEYLLTHDLLDGFHCEKKVPRAAAAIAEDL